MRKVGFAIARPVRLLGDGIVLLARGTREAGKGFLAGLKEGISHEPPSKVAGNATPATKAARSRRAAKAAEWPSSSSLLGSNNTR